MNHTQEDMTGPVPLGAVGEISRGQRFKFGANWRRFLSVLNEDRIEEATASLGMMLGVQSLTGCTFLDVGSGSGLFSLAARRLGARVHSFDYDPQSVACTKAIQERFCSGDAEWTIDQGSVLDTGYLTTLGTFNVVYSWGVLHHTGKMWDAMKNVSMLVAPRGRLFISIYNDQGRNSRWWATVKQTYCSGILGRWLVIGVFIPYFAIGGLVMDIIRGHNPVGRYTEYKKNRGMSRVHDWVDWLGGYPFEVATPEEVFDFYRTLGFTLERLKTCSGGPGCNEFVFLRKA